MTVEEILRYMDTWAKTYGEPPKPVASAREVTGFDITWAAVGQRLRALGHPKSLREEWLARGGGVERAPEFTLDQIEAATRAYWADGNDRVPGYSPPVDASKYFGVPVTWACINSRLVRRGESLRSIFRRTQETHDQA
jgi:hypothetical protein